MEREEGIGGGATRFKDCEKAVNKPDTRLSN